MKTFLGTQKYSPNAMVKTKRTKKTTRVPVSPLHTLWQWFRTGGAYVRVFVRGLTYLIWAKSWLVFTPLGVVLALYLFSYSPSDPAFTFATDAKASNWGGALGAWVSDCLLSAFGFSAWWFVLASFMSAIFAFRSEWRRSRGETEPERLRPPKLSAAFGFFVLLVGSSSLEALRLRRFETNLPGNPGGVLGDWLAFAVEHYVGVGLATVIFFVLIGMGLSLLMDFEWSAVCERVGRVIDFLFFEPLAKFMRRTREKTQVPSADAVHPVDVTNAENATTNELDVVAPAVSVPIFASVHGDASTSVREEPAFSVPAVLVDTSEEVVSPSSPQSVPSVRTHRVSLPKRSAFQPPLSLLDDADPNQPGMDEASLEMTSRLIVSKLKTYKIEAQVCGVQTGPVITQYWLEPGPGVKGSQIEGVRDDLRRVLGVQSVRVVPSIPGTSYIALEVPNAIRQMVRLKEILDSDAYRKSTSPLTLAMGKDIAGKPFTMDLAKTPHLLVAGTTGSGKSVGINAMILSMLYRTEPKDLRLVLIDPKMLEFSIYEGIPHLLCPVVVDMNKATTALKWLCQEMDRRYQLMSRLGVRHFTSYNEKVRAAIEAEEPIRDPTAAPDDPLAPTLEPWPYIVCIIDELADLILTFRKEVEGEITRLTQKARAAGMHLILATQRPSMDVVTGLIKANVPTRIAFQVASSYDSRVILGDTGAEQLLGNGDMLMHRPGMAMPCRIQGCFVADDEVARVVAEWKKYGDPVYISEVTESVEPEASEGGTRRSGESDPLYDRAVEIVLTDNRPSISYVQRQLGIGYNRAANLLEAMEAAGLVSAPGHAGKRTVLVPNR